MELLLILVLRLVSSVPLCLCGSKLRLLSKRPQAALELLGRHVARVVRCPIAGELAIDRVVFEPTWPLIEALDAVRRQRQHRGAELRVRVAVARPAVALPDEVALPAGGRVSRR